MKQFRLIGVLISCTVLLTGCPHEEYTLEIFTDNGVMKRQLTISGVEKDVPLSELDALTKTYQSKPTQLDKQIFRYTGTFKEGSTPIDIGGGSGGLTRRSNALGSIVEYVETFRGSDDVHDQIQTRFVHVDVMVDFFIGWMEFEFGDHPGHDELRDFIDRTLRADLKSLEVYHWMGDNLSSESGDLFPIVDISGDTYSEEVDAYQTIRSCGPKTRIKHFLTRHGYLSDSLNTRYIHHEAELFHLADLPMLLHNKLVNTAGSVNAIELVDTIGTGFANVKESDSSKLNYIYSKPDFIDFAKKMASEENDDYKIAFQYLQSIRDKKTSAFPHTAHSTLSTNGQDHLNVVFHFETAPFATNGKWDAKNRVIRWNGRIHGRPDEGQGYASLPDLCYARFATPNELLQKKRFGKVAITGSDLFEYTSWYLEITDAERVEWDKRLSTLTKNNIEQLLDFHFENATEPAVYAHIEIGHFYELISGNELPQKDTETLEEE